MFTAPRVLSNILLGNGFTRRSKYDTASVCSGSWPLQSIHWNEYSNTLWLVGHSSQVFVLGLNKDTNTSTRDSHTATMVLKVSNWLGALQDQSFSQGLGILNESRPRQKSLLCLPQGYGNEPSHIDMQQLQQKMPHQVWKS